MKSADQFKQYSLLEDEEMNYLISEDDLELINRAIKKGPNILFGFQIPEWLRRLIDCERKFLLILVDLSQRDNLEDFHMI